MVELVELLKAKSNGRSKNFYNIMPIDNIPSVIEHGILSFDKTRLLPHQSIALSDVQNRREKVQIPNGNSLHSYANLYFTYHNPMLYRRQDEAENLVRRYNQTTMIPKANLNKLITLNYFINGDIPRLTNIFNFAFGRRFSGELAFFSGKAPD